MLVSSLIPQNDVEELGKLPALFRHYRYHAQPAQGGLSLGQFLAQHYGADAPQRYRLMVPGKGD